MPAPPPVDRFQPSFLRFPIQNDRTGFKPVYLPMILVVPGRRDDKGFTLANSEVSDVRYFVADAPDPSFVSGPFVYPAELGGKAVNNQILVPQLSRFIVTVPAFELNDTLIDYKSKQFVGPDGQIKTFENAIEGDVFNYTLIRGQITSTIPWFPDADYYDLSVFTIDVEDLPRPKRYHFIWECRFNRRLVRTGASAVAAGESCITQDGSIAQYSILINHPGEVHHEMFRKTPPFLFDNDQFAIADNPILEFYRPYADILQDIFDEQSFLNGINHIDKVPAQLLPYLAYLIGWDLPNYPGVTDTVRRSVLRQAVHLQQMKGTKRVLIELFDIFGFTIDLINLWYSSDGTQFVSPGERLPNQIQGDQIFTAEIIQAEPMLANFSTPSFGNFDIPLLYKADDDIIVSAYLVKAGITKDQLDELVNLTIEDPGGTIGPGGSDINSVRSGLTALDRTTLISQTDVIIDNVTGLGTLNMSTSSIPLINGACAPSTGSCKLQKLSGVYYDPTKNIVHVDFDHYLDFNDDSFLYIFAEYKRTKIIVPPELSDNRANRFDLKILLKTTQEPVPALLEFLLNFVFKLKSFHSLLRKFSFTLEASDIYNVQDFCLGTDTARCGIPVGSLPGSATSPVPIPATCEDEDISEEELDFRNQVFEGLQEEFKSWRDCLDGTHKSDPALEHFLNLPVQRPSGDSCQFTQFGQNRVEPQPDVDRDQQSDTRPKLCQDVSPLPPLCFPGRVEAQLQFDNEMHLCEIVRCKPCSLGMGSGFFWMFPSDAQTVLQDGYGHFSGQDSTSFLGKKINRYNHPIPWSLHYTNRPYLIPEQLDNNQLLAYRRPSLEIEKDNLWFPSHRFVSMANMLNDFTHPTWKAKPWDYQDNDLNAVLVTGTGDDQYLEYDDVPLIYLGNGIVADISSLGTHEDRPFLVTHKVYLVNPSGHPAIKLDDRIVETTQEEITFDSSTPFPPIFKSYNPECNKDFRSGYPAVTGRFEVDIDTVDFDDDDRTDALGELLGLPFRGASENATGLVNALFTCGSGILVTPNEAQYRYYVPYRVDCDCGLFVCDGSSGGSFGSFGSGSFGTNFGTGGTGGGSRLNIDPCILNKFKLKDGKYDFNCDQLDMQPKLVLREKIGVCSTLLDGTIPHMLCILKDGVVPNQILPEGSYRFKDDYGTIFEGTWIFDGKKLDIVYLSKMPYVWGEPKTGFMNGRAVFRKGIITLTRQIYYVNNGIFTLFKTQSEQRVDFFQTNLSCGDVPFVDNFCFHVDCAVVDQFEGLVKCGTRWVIPDDQQVVWPDLIVDSSGIVTGYVVEPLKQPFIFMDVWGNEDATDVTAICPVGSVTGP